MSSKRLPLRARRRRARIILAVVALLILALLIYGVSWISYRPQYSVGSVRVVGAQTVPVYDIETYAMGLIYDGSHHFISRGNIFRYPKTVVEQDIVKNFPRIQSAEISRSSLFATDLTITVREREAYALWCSATSTCYQMDGTGFLFADGSASSSMTTAYVFKGGLSGGVHNTSPIGQSFTSAHLPGILSLIKMLQEGGFSPLGATIDDDQDFTIPFRDSFDLKASFGEDSNTLVRNLQLVLSTDPLRSNRDKIEYIDLRFGDRVYYKFKGEAPTSVSQ